MKYVGMVLVMVCLIGCASMDKATYVPSSNFNVVQVGSTQVQIDKSFVYVGEVNINSHSDNNIDDKHGSNVKITSHLFADISQGKNKVGRGMIVAETKLLKSTHYYRTEPSFTVGAGFVEKGFTSDIGGRCGYLIKRISALHPTTLKALSDNGYGVDSSVRNVREITFAKNLNTRWLTILYYESNATISNAAKHIKITE